MFQVKYEWEIQNFEGFSETTNSQICSPIFSASPDEITHRWKVGLQWFSKHPEYYGVYLHLENEQLQHPIYQKFNYKIFNKKNELVTEESLPAIKCVKTGFHGRLKAIDRSKCNFESIKRICLEIMLSRSDFLSSEEDCLERDSSEEDCSEEEVFSEDSLGGEIETIDPLKSSNSGGIVYHQSTKVLQEDLLKLYEAKEFFDITITCRDRHFQAHKSILATRSTKFKTMFEANTEDNIKLDDDIDPKALGVFLEFLYTGTIRIQPNLIDNILDLSEIYNMSDLSNICKCEMVKNISVSTAVKYLISADKHGILEMKRNVLKFMKENLGDIRKTEPWKTFMVERNDLMDVLLASIAFNVEES